MYYGLLHAHSGWRYVVTLMILITFFKALAGWLGKSSFGKGDVKLALFTMVATHIQFLMGIVLYVVSPKVLFGAETMSNDELRYWTLEHALTMIIVVALITIARRRAKADIPDASKFRTVSIFYLISLVLIALRVPMDTWF